MPTVFDRVVKDWLNLKAIFFPCKGVGCCFRRKTYDTLFVAPLCARGGEYFPEQYNNEWYEN